MKTGGAISVAYEYDARMPAARARLTVTATADCAGATVQVDSRFGWSSGRRLLDKPVTLELDLSDRGPNRFIARVFDAVGRPLAQASRDIVIERTEAATSGVPATHTIAVKLRDDTDEGNTLAVLVKKGTILPASGVAVYRVAEPLGAGDPGAVRFEMFQMDNEQVSDPGLNLPIGEFRIEGAELPPGRSLSRGDEIVVHWGMSEGGNVKADIDIPTLHQRFVTRNFYDYQAGLDSFEGEDGKALVDDEMERAQAELDAAIKAMPPATVAVLTPLRQRLDAQRVLAAGTSDPDTRRSVSEETRIIRQATAAASNDPAARQKLQGQRLADAVKSYDRGVRLGAAPPDNERADALARNARLAIEAGDKRSLYTAERQMGEIYRLYWGAGMRQFGFCASWWPYMRDTRHLARDRSLFDRTVVAGDAALAERELDPLRDAMLAIWSNRRAADSPQHAGELASLMQR